MNLYMSSKLILPLYETKDGIKIIGREKVVIKKKHIKELFEKTIATGKINTYIYKIEKDSLSLEEIVFNDYIDLMIYMKKHSVILVYDMQDVYNEVPELDYKILNDILNIKLYKPTKNAFFEYKEVLTIE